MSAAWVLAHQGGWDEMLMIAAPVGLFILLLRTANARASAAEERASGEQPDRNGHDPEEPR